MAGSLEEVELWLDRAEETLKASKALRDRGFYKDAVSRAYYAMFYAAKAAVVKEGVRGKKHSGVISAFGRLFAKTGRLEDSKPGSTGHSWLLIGNARRRTTGRRW